MTGLAVASASGAPGVTTTAALLTSTWPAVATVIEASPFGGTLAAAARLGWNPGLATLAAAMRRPLTPSILGQHSQVLPAGGRAVVGAATQAEALSSLAQLADSLGDLVNQPTEGALIVDCGRLWPDSPTWSLATAAELAVVVLAQSPDRPWETAAAVTHAAALIESLAEAGARPTAVVVGDRPYSSSEVAAALGIRVAGVIPDDRAGVAAAVAGNGPAKRRAAVIEVVRRLATSLAREVAGSAPAEVPSNGSEPMVVIS